MSYEQKIYLVSPREPSGITWLINCFLELGIKTYRTHELAQEPMWLPGDDGSFYLSKNENLLKKWLPVLMNQEQFVFLKNIEAIWTHELPYKKKFMIDDKVIFFIRDPRDSLFSRYKRESPALGYGQFLRFPDENSLLDKIDHWCLFNRSWSNFKNICVLKFEDYKKNPIKTLHCALKFLKLNFEERAISQAVENSSFEKAREAEERYHVQFPEDVELINRSGRTGEWKLQTESSGLNSFVESRTALWLERYGYNYSSDIENETVDDFGFLGEFLQLFEDIHLGQKRAASSDAKRVIAKVNEFILHLTPELIIRSKIKNYEAEKLLENISMFVSKYGVFLQNTAVKSFSLVGNVKKFKLKNSIKNLKNIIANLEWRELMKALVEKSKYIIKR